MDDNHKHKIKYDDRKLMFTFIVTLGHTNTVQPQNLQL
jgi:hypothetical protein